MEYVLYSYPNCPECCEVKEYLKKKGIKYEDINAGDEGRQKFIEFYLKNKDEIQRKEDGSIILPVFLKNEEFVQGLEKIIESLN